MAISDTRQGFVQNMQVISITQVSKLDQFIRNKKVAVECASARLPLSALPSGQPRSRPPNTEKGLIPEVTVKKRRQLLWRGLVWATTKIKNSCHLDSFLTYFLFLCKASPTYMDRNFLIPQDGYENMLKELCRRFVAFNPTDGKLMPVKKTHEVWKGLWLRAFYPRFEDDVVGQKIVDFRSNEAESVAEHLERSALYIMSYSCSCPGPDVRARKAFFPSLTLAQLRVMSRSSGASLAQEKEPLGLAMQILSDACSGCSGVPVLNYLFVPTTTWMLYFSLTRAADRASYKISQIPLKFLVHELHVVGPAEFRLAYVSVSTSKKSPLVGLKHQVSFMRFNEKFYFYDDADAGAVVAEPDPDSRVVSDQLIIEAVIYARM